MRNYPNCSLTSGACARRRNIALPYNLFSCSHVARRQGRRMELERVCTGNQDILRTYLRSEHDSQSIVLRPNVCNLYSVSLQNRKKKHRKKTFDLETELTTSLSSPKISGSQTWEVGGRWKDSRGGYGKEKGRDIRTRWKNRAGNGERGLGVEKSTKNIVSISWTDHDKIQGKKKPQKAKRNKYLSRLSDIDEKKTSEMPRIRTRRSITASAVGTARIVCTKASSKVIYFNSYAPICGYFLTRLRM